MKIACLNLGASVMSNIISGSEALFVKKCQLTYPENNGWYNSTKQISMCTFNAIQFLSEYDLFGVQEVNDKYKDKFIDMIKLSNKNYEFLSSSYHGDTSIMVGYDKTILGNGIQLTKDLKLSSNTDDRAIQIIWFKKHSLLFINLHAPHDINLKKEIERVCNSVKLSVIPKKIIMVGDFNDNQGRILNQSINIFGLELRLPLFNEIPTTCCDDIDYNSVGIRSETPLTGSYTFGDYILTTDYDNKNLYFGLPLDYNRNINLYSDHDPVVLLYF